MAEFLLIRHARTPLNDPANEKIRGYSDIPISYEGKVSTEKTRDFLKTQPFSIQRVISSPLQRAIMTASIVAEPFGPAQLIPIKGLTPWNLGDLDGTPVATAAKTMDYLQDNPDLRAPHGESYRDFFNRWASTFDLMCYYAQAHPEEMLVGVTHSRNLLALPTLLGARDIGDVPVKGGPGPESATLVSCDEDGNWTSKTIWDDTK